MTLSMTPAARAAPAPSATTPTCADETDAGRRLRAVLACAFTASVWALCHPYAGIDGDAFLYIGRILADLSPNGVGQDLSFRNDGQSQFTLFPALVRPLVVALGASRAALIVAACGSAAVFAASVWLAHRLAAGRTAWAIVIALSALPTSYGDGGVFSYAETNAVPRPFAEAAVLAMLAAWLSDRRWLAGALLLAAAAVHPIMALPGAGVLLILAVWRLQRRSRIAAVCSAIAAAGAALVLARLGVPLFARLLVPMDADWLGMVVARSAHLFPTLWHAETFGRLLVEATTILLAASLSPPATRRMLLAVLTCGIAGLAAAALLADTLHMLLAIQVQLWRVSWLVAGVAGSALVLSVRPLWTDGTVSRLVLALLILAWFVAPGLAVDAALCLLIVSAHALRDRLRGQASPRVVMLAFAVAGLAIVLARAPYVIGYVRFLQTMPIAAAFTLPDLLRNEIQAVPLCLLVAVWLLAEPRADRGTLALLAGATLLLAAAAVLLWNQRSAYRVAAEHRQQPPGFAAMMAGRPKEVLWIDGAAEAWLMLDAPQYMAGQQAVSIVFSRPLAMAWRQRVAAASAAGLARSNVLAPYHPVAGDDRPRADPARLAAFCHRAEAPGAVIFPWYADEPRPDTPGAVAWRTPAPHIAIERWTGTWHEVNGYVALPCAPARP